MDEVADGARGMRFLTTQEVADRLRTSPETVRYWRHRGEGPPAFKCGRRVLYPADELGHWVACKRQDQEVLAKGAAHR